MYVYIIYINKYMHLCKYIKMFILILYKYFILYITIISGHVH